VRRDEHAAAGGRRGRARHHLAQGGLNRIEGDGRRGAMGDGEFWLGFCRLCSCRFVGRGKEERRRRYGRRDEGDYVVQRRVGFWTKHAASVYGPNGFLVLRL
jgi:hypothetical protein